MRMMKRQIAKLPKWVKDMLENNHAEVERLKNKIERLENVAAIMTGREWFVIGNPMFVTSKPPDAETLALWTFTDPNRPFCVCTIGADDVLVIGRDKKKQQVSPTD